jgi:hypothetical protein
MEAFANHIDAPWAILDLNLEKFRCERCGGTEALPKLPMVLNQYVDVMQGFARRHADCEEPQ